VSELFIQTALQNDKTIISDCAFTSPLKIAKPFYRDTGYTELMIICASPGMLEGDRYDMRFDIGAGSKVIISGQSYQKLFDAKSGGAEQNLNIQVRENASLCYLPYPAVPFAGSRFRFKVDIRLDRSSKLFFGDILTFGRAGMGERFAFAEYMSRTVICVDDRPMLLDGCRLSPVEAAVDGIGFFEGYSCQGLLYLYGYEADLPQRRNSVEAAMSKARAGYVVRALGHSGDDVYHYAQDLFVDCSARIYFTAANYTVEREKLLEGILASV
jgi:urease accessory protein